jgi:hypothetical protein
VTHETALVAGNGAVHEPALVARVQQMRREARGRVRREAREGVGAEGAQPHASLEREEPREQADGDEGEGAPKGPQGRGREQEGGATERGRQPDPVVAGEQHRRERDRGPSDDGQGGAERAAPLANDVMEHSPAGHRRNSIKTESR